MSTVRAYNPEDAVVSKKGLENAAPVQVQIQQAQDLIKQMNEMLSFTFLNFEKKQTAHDINRKRLAALRWEEQWNQRCTIGGHSRCYMTNHHIFREGNYKHDVHPTIEEQDELIRNLRYKLLYKSNSLAEEKKLLRQIEEAVEIRETLVANPKPEVRRTYYARESNATQVYQAKQQKKKYEKKVLEDLDYKRKKLRSLEAIRVRMNEKKSRVHRIIYDLVKQQEQVPESGHEESII